MANNFDNRKSYNVTDDTDVTYTGESTAEIKKGDTFDKVVAVLVGLVSRVEALASQVETLESKGLNAASFASESDLFDLVDQSEAISNTLENKDVNLKVTPKTTGVDVFFDFSESVAALDPKYVPIGTDTSIRTYDGTNRLLGSSSSRVGTLTINKDSGPVIVTSRVNLRSPDGDQILSKSFYLPNLQADELTGKFEVYGISSQEARNLTQKDYNETLASNISRLQKTVSTLQKKIASIENK